MAFILFAPCSKCGVRATKIGACVLWSGASALLRGLFCCGQLWWGEVVFAQEALCAFGFRLAVFAFSYPFKKITEETENVEAQVGGSDTLKLIVY